MSRVSCWRWRILVVTVLAVAMALASELAFSFSPGFRSVAFGADAAAGKSVFETNACSACHGVAGEGGLGPSLATAAFAQKYANSDQLVSFIRQGGGSMPGFTEQRINKEQMDSLVGYVMSFSKAAVAQGSREGAASGQNTEARYSGFTFAQWYGLVVLGLGAILLALFAVVLNGPLKARTSR